MKRTIYLCIIFLFLFCFTYNLKQNYSLKLDIGKDYMQTVEYLYNRITFIQEKLESCPLDDIYWVNAYGSLNELYYISGKIPINLSFYFSEMNSIIHKINSDKFTMTERNQLKEEVLVLLEKFESSYKLIQKECGDKEIIWYKKLENYSNRIQLEKKIEANFRQWYIEKR